MTTEKSSKIEKLIRDYMGFKNDTILPKHIAVVEKYGDALPKGTRNDMKWLTSANDSGNTTRGFSRPYMGSSKIGNYSMGGTGVSMSSILGILFRNMDPKSYTRLISAYIMKIKDKRALDIIKRSFSYQMYLHNSHWKNLDLPTKEEILKWKNKDTSSMYNLVKIPKKKAGKLRQLEIPIDEELIEIQEKVKNLLRLHYATPPFVYSYIRGRCPTDLAEKLVKYDYIVNIDVKSAFEATGPKHLMLNNFAHFPKSLKDSLTNILFYKGHIPTGAVSSPDLFNISLQHIDYGLKKSTDYFSVDYYRYSDNIYLAYRLSRNKTGTRGLLEMVKNRFKDNGYELHKYYYGRPGKCKKYLGITTNAGFPSVPLDYRRKLRAEILKKGLTRKVKGKLAWINSVNKRQYNVFDKYIRKLKEKNYI